ncbi:rhodanese-like domain-containing protein [Tunicatimonas pelagia]|uniref:rhodanese-like domain-containing protein n=1 Tax=Tunicatimonas pelagia TaxID=931531 RepID=UPI002667179A|nr:rhodanese-like domain-containing protein [Tunicatimonas pelagia]WKN44345.1 rhodanese-like domain-containing protein [Tunicatimonas pelagia]
MKEITVEELKAMQEAGEEFQLIDVREPHEYEEANLGGELIPLGQLPEHVDEVKKDQKVIMQCRSGSRSANAVKYLENNHNFDNLYNLKGGILAYQAMENQ